MHVLLKYTHIKRIPLTSFTSGGSFSAGAKTPCISGQYYFHNFHYLERRTHPPVQEVPKLIWQLQLIKPEPMLLDGIERGILALC